MEPGDEYPLQPLRKIQGVAVSQGFPENIGAQIEAIPELLADIQLAETGLAVIGQGKDLAPADGRMYAVRDVTATVAGGAECMSRAQYWLPGMRFGQRLGDGQVIDAMVGVAVPNLTGGIAVMMPNHHLTKPVLIGEIQDDGQFEVVWQTPDTVVGDAWSDYLPGSKDVISDWRAPLSCGNYNVKTAKCSGQKYE